jgi:hypothetical protein
VRGRRREEGKERKEEEGREGDRREIGREGKERKVLFCIMPQHNIPFLILYFKTH